MAITKIYYNSTDTDMNVIGVDIIPAGQSVSITADNQPAVVFANYPGLVDLSEQDAPQVEAVVSAPLTTDPTAQATPAPADPTPAPATPTDPTAGGTPQ